MRSFPVRLRPATPADLGAIVALDRATYLAPHWPVAAYARILDVTTHTSDYSPRRCLIVAELMAEDETLAPIELAGFAVGLVQPRGDTGVCTAELEDVVVAAACRRSGIGRAVCAGVLDWCRSEGANDVILEVRAGNAGAIALYEQLGFEEIGRRPHYYRDPEDDAIVMCLRLTALAL